MKNLSTFAVSQTKGFTYNTRMCGDFYCYTSDICNRYWAVQFPVDCCTFVLVISLGRDGKRAAFFLARKLLNFCSRMTKRNKITSKVKHSSHNCTPTERNTVSYSQLHNKFKIEKDAKNKAYYFILSQGLLKDFAEFSNAHDGENYHQNCINILSI